MSGRSEAIREWSALVLGVVGTITGGISLYLTATQAWEQAENISVVVNPIRRGYESIIERVPHIPNAGGTIVTKWRVWLTNLSAREVTVVGNEVRLLGERGEVYYSGLVAGLALEGSKEKVFPRRLEPGAVMDLLLTLRYPVSKTAVDRLLLEKTNRAAKIAEIGDFIEEFIAKEKEDLFGNKVIVVSLDSNAYLFRFPAQPKNHVMFVRFRTARKNAFLGHGFWYKMYDPVR